MGKSTPLNPNLITKIVIYMIFEEQFMKFVKTPRADDPMFGVSYWDPPASTSPSARPSVRPSARPSARLVVRPIGRPSRGGRGWSVGGF